MSAGLLITKALLSGGLIVAIGEIAKRNNTAASIVHSLPLVSLLTLIWLVVVTRSLRTTRRALVNWTAGITMVWMLAMTLGLPLADQARSYRGVAQEMAPRIPVGYQCALARDVGDAQRALLYQYAALRFVRSEHPGASRCRVLLVQAHPARIPPAEAGWSEIWRGSRPGDKSELLLLYRR